MSPDRLTLVRTKLLVCIGLAAGFLGSMPLWFSERLYPLVPVFPGTPTVGPVGDWLLVGGVFASLIGVLVTQRPRWPLTILCTFLTLLALGDQSRWHPWFLWNLFFAVALLWAAWKPEETWREEAALAACRLLLVASYFWAGLQKINVTFYSNLFPWMLEGVLPETLARSVASVTSFAVPFVEMVTAVFLAGTRFRRLGVVLALAIHATALLLLGPLGHAVNTNVWAWNLTLAALVWTLFGTRCVWTLRDSVPPRSVVEGIALALFFVAPVFTFFDRWDAYAGFSLYSGSQRSAYVQLDEATKSRLPLRLRRYVDEQHRLVANRWSIGELRTPDYAEPRIYRALLAYLCREVPAPRSLLQLVVLAKPNRRSGERAVEATEVCP